jgi:hypothetical protein
MPQPNELSRSLVASDQNSTIIAVIEMSQSSWLVGGVLPGIERHPNGELPLGSSTGTDQTPKLCKKPVSQFHRRSTCSGVKVLRNASAARRQAAKLCYRFGPLTPSARSANLIAGDGPNNGFPAPNKELSAKPKTTAWQEKPHTGSNLACSSGESHRPDHRNRTFRRHIP